MRNNNISWLYLSPAIAILLFIFAYSVISLFWYSLVEWDALTPTFNFNKFDSFQVLFSSAHILEVLKNNILILIITIPVLVILGVFVSQVIYSRIFGWRIYQYLFFLPVIIPNLTVAIIWIFFLSKSGPINQIFGWLGLDFLQVDWFANIRFSLFGLIITLIWKDIGLAIILFLARLSSADTNLYDAAKIDGANDIQILRHITFPQLRAVIKLYVIILIIGLLNFLFTYIYMMTGGGPGYSSTVLEYYIYINAFMYKKIGVASSVAIILFIITSIFVLIYLRASGREEEE